MIGRLADTEEVAGIARGVLQTLVDQLRHTEERLGELDGQLGAQARRDETVQRLLSVPGVGPIVATALVATIGDARTFRSGRHLAAWIGLVPGQRSTGGKERLVGITKSGDGYLRRLLVNGARALTRWWRTRSTWLAGLLARRPVNVAAVALANKLARIVWAVMVRGEPYRASSVAPVTA